MRIAYFDCFSGAGGDMIVAALLHAGADERELRRTLDGLNVKDFTLAIEPVRKQGFAATRFKVSLNEAQKQPHRHLKQIRDIIESATLTDTVKDRAIRIFTRLAEAEARVHGTSVEKVHFHEVGAVDAVLDVVAAVSALERLGVERVLCSPLPVGSGSVKCEHGVMPVPAPAVAELLKNVPIAETAETGELTTPTAAAILTTLAAEFGPIPAIRFDRIGYGAGTREGAVMPNVLRVLIGESAPADSSGDADNVDEVIVLETNLDDATPQQLGHCVDRLLSEGALDAWLVPIQMKKSRPGYVLTVLGRPDQVDGLERIVFAETPTFGIRRSRATRSKLSRRHDTVATPYGPVRVKVGERDGHVTATPEYEDCRAAALTHGVALRTVMAAAADAWRRSPESSKPRED